VQWAGAAALIGVATILACSKRAADESEGVSPEAKDASVSTRDDASGNGDDAFGNTDVIPVPHDAVCNVTFRFMQKDAYKDGPGRTTTLWPPHTTTVLELSCAKPGETPALQTRSRSNHGTELDAKDDAGTPILVETKRATKSGVPAATANALANAFDACECGTKFLSMDAMGDEAVQSFVSHLIPYLEANLMCPPPGTHALTTALQNGDIDTVMAALPQCAWSGATSLAGGMDQALQAVVSATNDTLADYHVCNNDAKLEATLWASFLTSGNVTACDPQAAVCHSPLWFYTP